MMRLGLSGLLAVLLAACGETAPDTTAPVAEEPVDPPFVEEEGTFEPIGPATTGDDHTSDIAAVSDDEVIFRFVGPFEGGAALTNEDVWMANLQPQEVTVRAQNTDASSFADLAELYAEDVLAWSQEEKLALTAVIEDLLPVIDGIDQHLPEEVLLVLTGAVVEGGLPHTRGHAIIFAGGGIPMPGPGDEEGVRLTALFLHELHHVMSRFNSDLHDEYYALIGFEPCAFTEPGDLRAVRLTNPDAPEYKHYAPLAIEGADGVIPYLYASSGYVPGEAEDLGSVFSLGMVPVSYDDGICTTSAAGPEGLLSPDEVPGFGDVIGRNTGYIIHPEETLADNFVHWAMGREGLPNPEIPEAVGTFWLRPSE